jgi:ribosome-binding protein aMBF1 (putative translation factor)
VLGWKFYGKTVKELRKNQGLTAQELARRVQVKTSLILRIDEMRLMNVPEPLKTRITPVLKGEDTDKIPWL